MQKLFYIVKCLDSIYFFPMAVYMFVLFRDTPPLLIGGGVEARRQGDPTNRPTK